MPIDEARIKALLEKADPKIKLKRLEEDLDGNAEKNVPGYREQLLGAYRQFEAQRQLVERRGEERPNVNPLALEKFDRGQAEAELNLQMLEMQIELFVDEIENTEAQIQEIKQSGLTTPKPRSERRREAKEEIKAVAEA